MAGIYIHIPFCKQACYYCDFHFSTKLSYQEEMVDTLCREIAMRHAYLTEPIKTVYFGGGTPSLLSMGQLNQLMEAVRANFDLEADAEVTLEANPDDLQDVKLQQFYASGINRLSIGIQSFHSPHLHFLNRSHTAEQALACVENAQKHGFDDISIDLIYAIPANNHDIWEQDLQIAVGLGVGHISAYCLTIEERTVFGNWQKKGIIQPIDDSYAADQFDMLINALSVAGFEQYEVSNFARNAQYSKHNTAYWQEMPYLGIGPGSHSFDISSRQYTVSNNHQYMREMAKGILPFTKERLSPVQKCNEYLLTGLRTKWGCELSRFSRQGIDFLTQKQNEISLFQQKAWLVKENETIKLTTQGLLQADYITEVLFIE